MDTPFTVMHRVAPPSQVTMPSHVFVQHIAEPGAETQQTRAEHLPAGPQHSGHFQGSQAAGPSTDWRPAPAPWWAQEPTLTCLGIFELPRIPVPAPLAGVRPVQQWSLALL